MRYRRKLLASRVLRTSPVVLEGTVLYRRGWALSVPRRPGVYLVHDLRGVLYVGRTRDLLRRFAQHYDGTHNRLLAAALAHPVGETRFSWRTTTTMLEQDRLERDLISMFRPPCNRLLYQRNHHQQEKGEK